MGGVGVRCSDWAVAFVISPGWPGPQIHTSEEDKQNDKSERKPRALKLRCGHSFQSEKPVGNERF